MLMMVSSVPDFRHADTLLRAVAGLFQANDIDYEPSRQNGHEQVEGLFFFRGFTYLVEAQWGGKAHRRPARRRQTRGRWRARQHAGLYVDSRVRR